MTDRQTPRKKNRQEDHTAGNKREIERERDDERMRVRHDRRRKTKTDIWRERLKRRQGQRDGELTLKGCKND